jgi:hypothetical protein
MKGYPSEIYIGVFMVLAGVAFARWPVILSNFYKALNRTLFGESGERVSGKVVPRQVSARESLPEYSA